MCVLLTRGTSKKREERRVETSENVGGGFCGVIERNRERERGQEAGID